MKRQLGIRLALILLVIILLVIFFFTVFSYNTNIKIKDSNYWVVHTNKVLYKSEKVLSVLKDIETGTRGFVITDDSIFLQPYFFSKDSIAVNITDLKKLTSDNNTQQLRIDTLNWLANERLAICKRIQDLRQSSDYSLAAIKPLLSRGKSIMDSIRTNIIDIQKEEDRLLSIREKKEEENQDRRTGILYFIFKYRTFFYCCIFCQPVFCSTE